MMYCTYATQLFVRLQNICGCRIKFLLVAIVQAIEEDYSKSEDALLEAQNGPDPPLKLDGEALLTCVVMI